MAIKAEGIVGRGETYKVNPLSIHIKSGWNPRTDFTGHEELVEFIKENGPAFNPLRVKKLKEGEIQLIAGERRLKAVCECIESGIPIEWVPCIFERSTMSDTEAMLLTIFENEGKPFQPLEEAEAFQRLKGWGMNVSGIAKRMGKSEVFIYRRLTLIDASEELKQEIKDRKINLTEAEKIIKDSDGDTGKQKKKLAAKNSGKIVFSYNKKEDEITCNVKEMALNEVGDIIFSIKQALDIESKEFWENLEAAGLDPKTFKIECKAKAKE